MMQEKRGMLKIWNMWLVFATFWLAIFGTFLTRSGVVSSVHAFAQSSIGDWFVWFLAIIFAVFVFFFFKNRSHLRSEHKLESLVSRESSFLFNNLSLCWPASPCCGAPGSRAFRSGCRATRSRWARLLQPGGDSGGACCCCC